MSTVYTPPPPSRPVSPTPPSRPVGTPPSRLAAALIRRRRTVAALYGAAAITVPLLGAWIASSITHHKAADSDVLTLLLFVGLVAYAAVTIILTPTRRERQLRT